MRYHLVYLLLVALCVASVGCSTQRMQLSKSDPPKNLPQPEERVKYGFPWSKPKADEPVARQEIPQEIKDKLAKSNTPPKRTADTKEILARAADAESRGDLDSARAAYLQVVELDPKSVEAHHRLGVISDMRQDPQSADQHYLQAYAVNRRDADLLCDMGYSLYLRGRLEESERRLKEALEVNAYHRAALSNLGLVYGKQGRYDDALAMFRKAGTESEAQRNIAQLFPNGKPGESPASLMTADHRTQPLPLGTPNSTAAPPMPADIDHRLASLATDPVQPGPPLQQPAPTAQSLAQLGNLQPSLPTTPPNNIPAPAAAPFAPNAAAVQPAVAAKPQGSGNPWTGNLERPMSANDYAALVNPAPTASSAMMSPSPMPNPYGNPAVPNVDMSAFPAMPAVAPANFQSDPYSTGVVPAVGYANSAEASRIAAQIAMASGPGGMMPFSSTTTQPDTTTFGSLPNSTSTSPSNRMAFEYGNLAPTANPANFSVPATWANERSLGAPVEAVPTQNPPAANWGNLAPASPWASSASPAGDTSNWRLPPDHAPRMTPGSASPAQPPAYPSPPSPLGQNSTNVQPPPWSGNANPAAWPPVTNPASNGSASSSNGASTWPVIQPGSPTPARAASNDAPTSGSVTVPDWPYARPRPN